MSEPTYRTSETTATLFAALNVAQGVMASARKDATNPHFNSKYADLASVWDAVRTPLAENGLTVIQVPSAVGPVVTVTTILAHKCGEWIAGELAIASDKNTAQGLGSALTYARRYALAAFLGVAPEDDDGNEAVGGKPAIGSKKAQEDVASRKITEMQKQPELARPKTKDLGALKAFSEMKELIGEKLYRSVLSSHGFAKSNEITDEAKAREIYKQMTGVRKVVAAAQHGELLPGINEEIFTALPDTSISAVMIEYKNKLTGLCGTEVALSEFEALRKKAGSQWEFANLLQVTVTKLAAQQGLG